MSTFSGLKTSLSHKLRDPANKTFDDPTLGELVNEGLVEVGRLAPQRFQEDIVPTASTLSYQLQSSTFGGVAIPEIEVRRVELWDASYAPPRFLSLIDTMHRQYVKQSDGGWELWNGTLTFPNWLVDEINITVHLYRVWGYAPYPALITNGQVVGCSYELESAVLLYARLEALRRLSADRDLYTQWQAHANVSDVSPASLLSAVQAAEDAWRRKAKAITVLRS